MKDSDMTLRFLAAACLMLTLPLALTACGDAKQDLPSVTISTAQGPVQGVTTADLTITNFKGVPFAAPPVGDLRWTAPKPAAPWSTVKTADTFSPMCRQSINTEGGFFDRIINGQGLSKIKRALINKVVAGQPAAKQSEDCLYLNVRSPNLNIDGDVIGGALPVMVWIHGGAHQFGSGDFNYYQGNALPKKGVVLITINYRLGAFGYMAHPALSEDSPHGVSGNYGLLDQIAALNWVQDNINAYGGDPSNVTIFGESAGGWSVTELMSSPLAKGLFHKAIGQSGASTYHLGDLTGNDTVWPSGHDTGLKLAQRLGLTETASAADLRALNADAILAQMDDQELYDGMHPVRDGHVLPKNVGLAFRDGDINAVPVMFGYNDDEGTLFFPDDREPFVWLEGFPKHDRALQLAALKDVYTEQTAQTLLDLYPGISYSGTYDVAGADIMGDDIFGVNVRYAARQSEKFGQPAYLYAFTRVPPSKNQTIGAFHAAELPFVFGTHEPILGVSGDDKAATELMQLFWTNFAKTGNPNNAQTEALAGQWKRHAGQHWFEITGNTDRVTGPLTDYNKERLDALEVGLNHHLDKIDPTVNSAVKTQGSTVADGAGQP